MKSRVGSKRTLNAVVARCQIDEELFDDGKMRTPATQVGSALGIPIVQRYNPQWAVSVCISPKNGAA